MISLNTLVFPNTDIFKDRLYPLLLFCSPLHFLLPVEPDPTLSEKNETDIFMERGLCQAHTPEPLSENRDRFLHLVKDIENRKDDYAAQLSSLTMAAMTDPGRQKGGENRHEILSALLGGTAISTPEERQSNSETWQSRLVLAIAEILDREEELLQQHLQILDSSEIEMLKELRGDSETDDDDPFSQLEQIKERMLRAKPGEMKKRFKAWLQLMSRSPLPELDLWVATSRDSGDQVINAFEKRNNATAIPVLGLKLPLTISISPSHLVTQLASFHNDTKEIHKSIRSDLVRLATNKDYDPARPEFLIPDGTDWVDRWQAVLDNSFPESSHGRTDLTIFLLPESPIARLFNLRETSSGTCCHGLLGILDSY